MIICARPAKKRFTYDAHAVAALATPCVLKPLAQRMQFPVTAVGA